MNAMWKSFWVVGAALVIIDQCQKYNAPRPAPDNSPVMDNTPPDPNREVSHYDHKNKKWVYQDEWLESMADYKRRHGIPLTSDKSNTSSKSNESRGIYTKQEVDEMLEDMLEDHEDENYFDY